MNLVEINELKFSYYDNLILKNINFNVNENEKVLLIGPNGAGKSTLIRVMVGAHMCRDYTQFNVMGTSSPKDQFGGIAYLGNRWVRNVNFIGQSTYMADIKVKDMMKKNQQENKERRDELVNLLQIDLEWRMHQVSDGQRKRVQIMLELLKPFKLLFIDEFTNELDVVVRDKFFHYLEKECKLRNAAVVYATHIFDGIEEWATHVVYISNGITQEKKTVSEFNTSKNLYHSVKNKMIHENNQEINLVINDKKIGKQGGWESGRSQNF